MRIDLVRRAAVALLVAALALAGCGDDDDAVTADDTTTTTTETTTTTTSEAPETTEETTTTAPPDHDVIEVTVADGEVTGGGRHAVDLGETVTIEVTSDVADHIHLHGYDVLADVGAGETAELVFDATIPGVFEVELEDARIHLLDLEIS